MAAGTKVEQMMWIQAFAVIFELRARLLMGLSNTIETTIHVSPASKNMETLSLKSKNH